MSKNSGAIFFLAGKHWALQPPAVKCSFVVKLGNETGIAFCGVECARYRLKAAGRLLGPTK